MERRAGSGLVAPVLPFEVLAVFWVFAGDFAFALAPSAEALSGGSFDLGGLRGASFVSAVTFLTIFFVASFSLLWQVEPW